MVILELFRHSQRPADELIALIRKGLPASLFTEMAKFLGLSSAALAEKLGISSATLPEPGKGNQVLSAAVSEKLVRVAKHVDLGRKIFMDYESAAKWLTRPAPALNGVTPIDLMDTEFGAREVEGLLQGIAFGHVM